MAGINPSWSAGARSADTLNGDGWYSFSVPSGAVGVSVGLGADDTSTDPSEPTHGFLFETGVFRVVERGVARTLPAAFASTDTFALVRYGARVLYCRSTNGQPVRHVGVPFALPGMVVYESLNQLPPGAVLLDAALLMGGDRVVDAECVSMVGADLRMEPMVLAASENASAWAALHMEPMALHAGIGYGADLRMEPMAMVAMDVARAMVHVAFEVMQAAAGEGATVPRGAYLQMQPPQVAASGPGQSEDRADLAMEPMALAASETTHAETRLRMEPMTSFSVALGTPIQGPRFTVVLPAFMGGGEPPVEDDVLVSEAWADEVLYPSHYTMVEEVAIVEDLPMAAGWTEALLEDGAVADELLLQSVALLLEDTAWVGDELPPTSVSVLLADLARADEALLPQSDGTVLLADQALADDSAMPFALADVEDEAVADELLQVVAIAQLDDEAWADDATQPGSVEAVTLIEDDAWADDAALAQSHSIALLGDEAMADEVLVMKTPGLVAWVMNADTGAVSWYDNWGFTDMAVVGGKVFASGPDGLVVLGGDSDGADAIDARVVYGFNEFGGYDQSGLPKPNEVKKRIPALWFGYHAAGTLQATVETYGQGYGTFRYAMQPRDAQQPRNNRILPGKGLNARYWRIGIENTNGCAFEVHSIAAEVAASSRRL